MGCVSSKHARKDLKRELAFENGGGVANHVVSLTSSTYGVLELDGEPQCVKKCVIEVKKSSPPREEPAEVINAWELMEDLDETEIPCLVQSKKSPKPRVFLDTRRSPLRFLNQKGSPKRLKRFGGKENNGGRAESSPKTVLKNKVHNLNESPLKQRIPKKESPETAKRDGLGPLFDPELIAYFEKELSAEAERKKKALSSPWPIISRKPRNPSKDDDAAEAILEQFDKILPPGGENAVVLYITTLRGIRKTFEDCNTVRSILESHQVRTSERDISMHSGFREELRGLMGTTEVRVPVVFVKGRLIGGADEVVKLEEEGKLGIVLAGISRAAAGCGGCGGIRFVLCLECHGSCKVWDEDGNGKSSVKCGECNENGLIQCPICC
ncbi:PREDICTED: uncharacterized protein At3g28850-like isoform X2 [Ipomoea nil]|uniref:uncharacterized protein At3g28850-like isoform X2 n=1 Tax=Ipomoea nil TaxID=35883 RepID=UPI0009019659|nr:PREDICTED: uncharacterized protein At3g28850-like isoform X2 [Ipomoea nil]